MSFWAGKKVFITGHTGFKGSWLSLWLKRLGAEVIGYSLPPPTKPSLFEVGQVADGIVSITGDVRSLEQVRAMIAKHQPEIIFHMAAQTLVRYSYIHPVETYSTNVMGTVNILEAVRESKSVRAIVIITSDKCYENKEMLWGYRESDALGGSDPYSSSKGCAELVASAFRRSYFSDGNGSDHKVSVATVRAGNVIGGGDWAEGRLIPDIMKAIMGKRPVMIRNPNAVRPWQHVLEPLQGYMMLAERLWLHEEGFSEAWNFGPDDGDAKPVAWVVEYLTNLWGEGAIWDLDTGRHFHEAACLKLDSTKAKNLLGWSPKLSLQKALDWTVEWYRSYEMNEDMHAIMDGEIEQFGDL